MEQDCEAFTLAFLRCIRFVPQISFESYFTIDESSGRLAISRTYRHLFYDSPPFSMAAEFFTTFPAFKNMMPKWKDVRIRQGSSCVVYPRESQRPDEGADVVNGALLELLGLGKRQDHGSVIPDHSILDIDQIIQNSNSRDDFLGLDYLLWIG